MTSRRLTVAVLACAASFAAVAATAQDQAPTGAIHVCVGANGRMRALPASDSPCRPGERHVDWSAGGRDGARGRTGPAGPPGASLRGRPGPPGEDAIARPAGGDLVRTVTTTDQRSHNGQVEALGHYTINCDVDHVTKSGTMLWAGVASAYTFLPRHLARGRGVSTGSGAQFLKEMQMNASPWRPGDGWRIYRYDLNFANAEGRAYELVGHRANLRATCYDPPGELAAPPAAPSVEFTAQAVVIDLQSPQTQVAPPTTPTSGGQAQFAAQTQGPASGTASLRQSATRSGARSRAAAATKKKKKLLGRGRFDVKAAGTHQIAVQLTRAARALLRRRGRLNAVLEIRGTMSDGKPIRSRAQIQLLRLGVRPGGLGRRPPAGTPRKRKRKRGRVDGRDLLAPKP